mmetsp:Transcript_24660/g.59770  ORF Transcript_24660/g.59770 Transcript_24660/m.59770 type:complete len:312 (-) Transcript_24660:57-992(-)
MSPAPSSMSRNRATSIMPSSSVTVPSTSRHHSTNAPTPLLSLPDTAGSPCHFAILSMQSAKPPKDRTLSSPPALSTANSNISLAPSSDIRYPSPSIPRPSDSRSTSPSTPSAFPPSSLWLYISNRPSHFLLRWPDSLPDIPRDTGSRTPRFPGSIRSGLTQVLSISLSTARRAAAHLSVFCSVWTAWAATGSVLTSSPGDEDSPPVLCISTGDRDLPPPCPSCHRTPTDPAPSCPAPPEWWLACCIEPPPEPESDFWSGTRRSYRSSTSLLVAAPGGRTTPGLGVNEKDLLFLACILSPDANQDPSACQPA